MIPLFSGEPEKAFFQDGVAAIPQRQRKAKVLMAVADAGNPVFAPAIGARAGMVVREVVPGGAVRAVVLANGSPLALAQVRSPALPVELALRDSSSLCSSRVIGSLFEI